MADDRDIAQHRDFIDGLRLAILDHAGNDDRCAVFDQNGRFSVGRLNDRHPLVGCFRREETGDGTHLGLDQHANIPIFIDGWRYVKLDANIHKCKVGRFGCRGIGRGRGRFRIRLLRNDVDGRFFAFFSSDMRVGKDLGFPMVASASKTKLSVLLPVRARVNLPKVSSSPSGSDDSG